MPRSNNPTSSDKSAGEGKATSTVSCQLSKDLHEQFRAKLEVLGTGFTNHSVLTGLIKFWLDGKIELPVPHERIKADALAALSKLLDMDVTKAEEITRTINSLSKAPQVIKQ